MKTFKKSFIKTKTTKINMVNKKSQIASTLTWFAGFLIIFFIIIIFVSASVVISANKIAAYGQDEITIQNYEGNIKSLRGLVRLLNTNFEFNGEQKPLKNIFSDLDMYNLDASKKQELNDKIREKILGMKTDKDCYVFEALWGIKDSSEMVKNADSRGAGYVSDFIAKSSLKVSNYDVQGAYDPRGASYVSSAESKNLKKSAELVLLRGTKKNVFGVDEKDFQIVNVKFYIGAC